MLWLDSVITCNAWSQRSHKILTSVLFLQSYFRLRGSHLLATSCSSTYSNLRPREFLPILFRARKKTFKRPAFVNVDFRLHWDPSDVVHVLSETALSKVFPELCRGIWHGVEFGDTWPKHCINDTVPDSCTLQYQRLPDIHQLVTRDWFSVVWIT